MYGGSMYGGPMYGGSGGMMGMGMMPQKPKVTGEWKLWHHFHARNIGICLVIFGILILMFTIAGVVFGNVYSTAAADTSVWNILYNIAKLNGWTDISSFHSPVGLRNGITLWTGIIYIIAGVFGILAHRGELCSAIAFIIMCIISAAIAAVFAISYITYGLVIDANYYWHLTNSAGAATTDATDTVLTEVRGALSVDAVLIVFHTCVLFLAMVGAMIGCCRNYYQVHPMMMQQPMYGQGMIYDDPMGYPMGGPRPFAPKYSM